MAEKQETSETRTPEGKASGTETPLTREECFQLALQEYYCVIQQAFGHRFIVQPPKDLAPSINSGIDAVFLCACIGFLNLLVASEQPDLNATRTLRSFVEASAASAEPTDGAAEIAPKLRADTSATNLGQKAEVPNLSIQQLLDFSKKLIDSLKAPAENASAGELQVLENKNTSTGESQVPESEDTSDEGLQRPTKMPRKGAGIGHAIFSLLGLGDKPLAPKGRALQGAYDNRKENVFAIVEAELQRLREKIPPTPVRTAPPTTIAPPSAPIS